MNTAAMQLAERGYRVFPLCDQGKLPRKGSNGLLDATCDQEQIEAAWGQWPNANIGLSTDGLVVVDIDLLDRKTGKPNPWLADEPDKLHSLLAGAAQVTWSGGRQFIFRQPEGKTYRNTDSRLAPKVDTRASGGYAVVAPSHVFDRKLNKSGTYQWVNPLDVEPQFLAEPPAWLQEELDAIEANRGKSLGRDVHAQANGKGIPEGKRNSTLTSLAGTMHRRGMPQAAVEAALTVMAQRCEGGDVPNVAKIAASVARYEPASSLIAPENRTDEELGRRFAREHGEKVRYVASWGKPLVYDGARWKLDEGLSVEQLAKLTAGRIWEEVLAEIPKPTTDAKAAVALLALGKYASSVKGTENTLTKAWSEPGIVVSHTDLDTNPWLFNVKNGTVNLKDGRFRPHDRTDLITQVAPVEFDADADCPRWIQFVREIMAGSAELTGYLRRLVGYWLTGSTQEHVLPIFYGVGANGKSVFINTIEALMGTDYAMSAASDLLMAKRHAAHPTEQADLFGKRMVSCSEVADGGRLNESLVKRLTGGDSLRARRMREDFWQFVPTHKIVVTANHKPVVTGQDHGLWRRLRLVPFEVVFATDKQDKLLPDKLKAELPGILNWAIMGCIEWRAEGLGEPTAVMAATCTYRNEQDIVGEFLEDKCVLNPRASVKASQLYDAFKVWCKAAGEQEESATAFGRKLTDRGYHAKATMHGKVRVGIGLSDESRVEA